MMQRGIVAGAGAALVMVLSLAWGGTAATAQTDTTTTSTPTTTTKPRPKTIKVTASSFKFKPNKIDVAAGQKITISLHSTDQLHDFVIQGKGKVAVASGGKTKKGSFTIKKAGKYTFYCSIDSHRAAGMEGTITVS
jgi:plastocyanin